MDKELRLMLDGARDKNRRMQYASKVQFCSMAQIKREIEHYILIFFRNVTDSSIQHDPIRWFLCGRASTNPHFSSTRCTRRTIFYTVPATYSYIVCVSKWVLCNDALRLPARRREPRHISYENNSETKNIKSTKFILKII